MLILDACSWLAFLATVLLLIAGADPMSTSRNYIPLIIGTIYVPAARHGVAPPERDQRVNSPNHRNLKTRNLVFALALLFGSACIVVAMLAMLRQA